MTEEDLDRLIPIIDNYLENPENKVPEDVYEALQEVIAHACHTIIGDE